MEKSLSTMMTSLNEMRKTASMTDVTIVANTESFHAHALVLRAASPLLRELISSETKVIKLTEIDSGVMEILLTAIYTGKMKNVFPVIMRQLLHACTFLQTEHIYARCCDSCVEQLTSDNCIEVWCIAQEFGNQNMINQVISYIIDNSFEVAKSHQVELLLAKQMNRLTQSIANLSSDLGHQVRLILGWLKFDIRNRKNDADDMLSTMDFSRTGNLFINHLLESQQHLPKAAKIVTDILTARRMHEREAPLAKVLEGDNAIFFFGRNNNRSCFQVYNPKWQTWSKVMELPFNLTDDVGTAVYNNAILFIGGGSYYWETPQSTRLQYRTHADVIEFTYRTQSAKFISKLNNARADIRTVTLGDKVYAIGGYKNGRNWNFAERYDSHSKVWEDLQPMRNAHRVPYVVSFKGFLYVFGGLQSTIVEKYHPILNQWTELTRLPGPAYNFWPFGTTCEDKILIKTSAEHNTFQIIEIGDERIGYNVSPPEVMNYVDSLKYMCAEYKDEQMRGIIIADDRNKLVFFDPETKRWISLPGKVDLNCVWSLTAIVTRDDTLPEDNQDEVIED